jgi:hypothetical protein
MGVVMSKNILAFPVHPENYDEDHEGMTLRDYFAAKAVQGFMGSSWNVKSFEEMASKAYQLADAMMKAREQ